MPFPDPSLQLLLAVLLLACVMALSSRKRSSKLPNLDVALPNEAPIANTKTPGESRPAIMSPVATSSQEKDRTKNFPSDSPPEDIDPTAVRQSFDAFLVLDVEATCMPGTDFNYANEIIASRFQPLNALRLTENFLPPP